MSKVTNRTTKRITVVNSVLKGRLRILTNKYHYKTEIGKISAQPHTIVKQICFPNGNLLFLSLFSQSKN